MRVCIFSTAYLPFVGGAEIAVKEITKRLNSLQDDTSCRFEFDLFTARLNRKLPKFEKIDNINVYRIGLGFDLDKRLLALLGGWLATKKHRIKPYGIVWSIMASYGGFAALSFKKKNPDVPFLLTLQEGDAEKHILRRVRGFKWRFRQIFEYADAMHCISRYLLEWGRRMGFRGGKFTVIPNGVDVQLFSKDCSANDAANFKAGLGIGANDKIVVTVSRLTPKNGITYLIDALKFFPENVHCVIVGEGELEASLKKQALNLGVQWRAHFLGYVEHENLPLILKSSDVFCRPSLSEGMGNVFLESMAAGVPVVTTGVGGIADIIQDGVTGLYCRPRDARDLALKVMKFINEPDIRLRCVERGLVIVRDQFDWDNIANKMKMFMQEL